jgi:HlyD family secretion protein
MISNRSSQSTAGLAVLSLVCAATASGCAARVQAQSVDAAPVAVAIARAASPGERPLYRGPGTAVAPHTYRVGFEISGRVTDVRADVGDRVAAGETLATLDDADLRSQSQAALARASSSDAQALRAERGSRPQERAQAAAGVAAAQASLARALAAANLAHLNDERFRTLAQSGDVAAQQADAARTAAIDADQQVAAARAQLASAQESASLVDRGPRDEDRAAAEAEARAARAGAALAEITLRKATLRAPADAYVQSRSIENGDLAQPGAVAFVLEDAGPADVLVAVPESRLGSIGIGTRAIVYAEGRALAGRVARLEPAADDAAHAFTVRVRLGGARVRPGTVADVALGERTDGDAAVPTGALVREEGGWFVETYDAAQRTVQRNPVRIVESDGARTIVDGVRAGRQIVVMGQHDARPGDAVRVVSQ